MRYAIKSVLWGLFYGGALLLLPALTLEQGSVTVTQSQTSVLGQPADERKVQDSLPMAKDSLWGIFSKLEAALDEQSGTYHATIPDSIKAKVGQTIAVSGFIMPLEASEHFTHFLLSKRTPTCSFCPPGQPNEIIEVYAQKPLPWDDGLVTFQGVFALGNNQDMGVFLVLKDAVKVH